MKLTLRGMMTNEIRAYHWLDSYFERGDYNAEKFKKDKSEEKAQDNYESWLDSLENEIFLSTYNRMRDSINNLS